jgi:DNA-binding response OmpR family regulator
MGFDVDIATNFTLARNLIKGKKHDLLLFDIGGPKSNGEDFYRWLKKRHPDLANKVIFTTGDTLNENIKGFLKRSNRPFVVKPYTIDELEGTVTKVIRI